MYIYIYIYIYNHTDYADVVAVSAAQKLATVCLSETDCAEKLAPLAPSVHGACK